MANTYTLISSVTVGAGGASSIDFTSIPSTYTDLVIKYSIRNASTFATCYLRFNASTTSYTGRRLFVNSTTVSSDTVNADVIFENPSSYTASTFASNEVYIPNYAGSNNKSASIDFATENNAAANYEGIAAELWSNTAAITQVSIVPAAGTFAQYSTAYLYGIKNSQENKWQIQK